MCNFYLASLLKSLKKAVGSSSQRYGSAPKYHGSPTLIVNLFAVGIGNHNLLLSASCRPAHRRTSPNRRGRYSCGIWAAHLSCRSPVVPLNWVRSRNRNLRPCWLVVANWPNRPPQLTGRGRPTAISMQWSHRPNPHRFRCSPIRRFRLNLDKVESPQHLTKCLKIFLLIADIVLS